MSAASSNTSSEASPSVLPSPRTLSSTPLLHGSPPQDGIPTHAATHIPSGLPLLENARRDREHLSFKLEKSIWRPGELEMGGDGWAKWGESAGLERLLSECATVTQPLNFATLCRVYTSRLSVACRLLMRRALSVLRLLLLTSYRLVPALDAPRHLTRLYPRTRSGRKPCAYPQRRHRAPVSWASAW